jgi:hypothetical protein
MSPEINLKGHCKCILIKLHIRNSYSNTPTLKRILVEMRILKCGQLRTPPLIKL